MAYLSRFLRISWAMWGYLLWWVLVRVNFIRPRLSPAEKLSRVLQRLGVTFIKLGQGLSLRRDLLPDEYISALQCLQDKAASFAGETAIKEVERAFNRPVQEIFVELEVQPLAAAIRIRFAARASAWWSVRCCPPPAAWQSCGPQATRGLRRHRNKWSRFPETEVTEMEETPQGHDTEWAAPANPNVSRGVRAGTLIWTL